MRDFKTLQVWQKAHEMTLSIYETTQQFPPEETYGLSIQLRRAAASVPANIAEGCGCNGNREFVYFLRIALRSASETEYHLLLAKDLKYVDTHGQSPWHFTVQALLDTLQVISHSPTGKTRGTLPFGFVNSS